MATVERNGPPAARDGPWTHCSRKAFAQIPDAASEDAYMSTDARTLVELGGGRTVVGVPLRKETSLLGAITIFRQEVKTFTEHQIEVLQTSPRKRSSRWRTRGC